MEAERPGGGSFPRTAKWPWLDSSGRGVERGAFCTDFEHGTSRISWCDGSRVEGQERSPKILF